MKVFLGKILLFLCILGISGFLLWHSIEPSGDRDWNADQAFLPKVEIKDGRFVKIDNVRNFKYASTTEYLVRYYTKTYDADSITSLDYVVEPFSGYPGAAHTFLSFGFKNGDYVSISVEIRKEKGDTFSAFRGLLKDYELMYVIADERDVIGLRANHRKDDVFLYPIKTSPDKMKAVFLDMVARAEKLRTEPEFYNTVLNNCTTNIARHVNTVSPGKIPFTLALIFPADSDRKAYELGLIDTNLTFEEARVEFKINALAEKYKDDPFFSKRIREGRTATTTR